MTFKKIILKIHLWLGLGSGLIIVILGITGCIYVFDEELRPIVYHDSYYADETKNEQKPLSELLKITQDSIGKDKPINALNIRNEKNATVTLYTNKTIENKNPIWYWDTTAYNYHIFINPFTGKIQKIEDATTEFFEVVFSLHWSLLLTNDIGQPIVGIAVIIFIISLITGLILWWPKNKAAAKQRYWFRWKNTTQWKRKNYDLHNILGFYVTILALLIALTGLVWSFEWVNNGVKWIANGGQTIENTQKEIKSDVSKNNNQNPLDKIYATLKNDFPNAESYNISIPEDSLQSQFVFVDNGGSFDKILLQFDQYTGKLLDKKTYDDRNNGDKIRSLNYDIHAGGILGLPGKILAFFASFICASLPVTGFYIWWGRNNKKKKTK
ncbi:putative iron-regulated membrane protein [Flavobacterium sp. 9]|uniref:PepSY-associated TM helix domain-containing protein n=1 Tax=Flavobacterium sp. 9 TaxID=2035198 RepID=UPI000C186689|nr:PepSY-associated TM helix domain-containing protein [Flavobacterium sp. 9]PIF33507.1 putative iron-regulated membrane protein [Flavobacterium sp. 9]